MPFKNINGIEMHYEHHLTDSKRPSKEPLVLLSGMASDCASWQPVVQTLRQQHELIVPDNRCTGRTTPMPVNTNRDLMVSDILHLLDSLAIDQVNIVGHSMGGMLGWAVASHAPDRIKHLVSACALPTALSARVALFKSLAGLRNKQNEALWFEHLYHFLFSHSFFEDAEIVAGAAQMSISYPHKQSAQAFAIQAQALASFQEPINLQNIHCPVTLLIGANDILTTPAMVRTFCSEHPDINYTIIEGAAHALHWEKSEEVSKYILSALRT